MAPWTVRVRISAGAAEQTARSAKSISETLTLALHAQPAFARLAEDFFYSLNV